MTEAESLEIYETARSKHEPALIESGDVAAYKAAVDPLWDEHLKRTGQQVITSEPATEADDGTVDYGKLNKAQLLALLEERGLDTSPGKNAELAARLIAADEAAEADSDDAGDDEQ